MCSNSSTARCARWNRISRPGAATRAIAKAKDFIIERLNGEDGLGAIYPAMANAAMMFDLLGDRQNFDIAYGSVKKLLVVHGDEAYCQPCLSPVWDTGLAAHALAEAGSDAPVAAACDWLIPRQILDVVGDWADNTPGTRPGGWAFQYNNAHYPDVDDTAVVGMILHRAQDPAYEQAIARAGNGSSGCSRRTAPGARSTSTTTGNI